MNRFARLLPAFTLAFVIPGADLLAQAPSRLAVTSVLTDAAGNRFDGPYNLTFRLYETEENGPPLWQEMQDLEVENGILQAMLGEVEPLTLPFDTTYYLGIAVNGGSELAPRLELSAAAYSIIARYVSDEALVAGENVSITRNERNQLVVSASGNGGTGAGNTLSAADGSPQAAVYVDEEGRVGIGRTDPLDSAALSVDGPISFSGRPDSTSAIENPILYVFEEGTENPTRAVFAHSPGDRLSGLFYEDGADRLHFRGGEGEALTIRLDSLRVGINNVLPREALSVGGIVESVSGGFRFPDGSLQTTAADGGDSSLWSANGNKIFYNDGFVGVGTNNPLSKFHLFGGDLTIQDDFPVLTLNGAGANKIISFQINGADQGNLIYSNGIGLRANAGADLVTGSWVLSDNGNFGLGLSSPQRKLHVHFDNNNGITSQMLISQAGGGDAWMNFGLDGGVHYAVGIDNSDGDKFKIGYSPTEPRGVGDNTRLTINDVGRVGIGITDPRVKLDVNGALKLATTTVTDNGIIRYTGSDFEGRKNGQWISLTGGPVWSTSANDVFYTDGRVGIGTKAPGTQLTISRPTQAASYQLELRNESSITSGNYDGIEFTQGSAGSTRLASMQVLYNNNGQPDMAFNLRNDSNVLYLEAGGNVGINTSNPGERLDVNGNIRTSGEVRRTATGSANMVPICYGNIDATGTINAGSGNFSVTRSAAGRYDITISGESVFFEDYIVSVNLAGEAGFASFSSISGKLRINTYNFVGVVLQADRDFSFVVYKP